MAAHGGYLGPWPTAKKVALGAPVAVVLLLVVLVTLPLGAAAVAITLVAARVWQSPSEPDPVLGTYILDSRPYKVASFLKAYDVQKAAAFSPLIALGFGPPGSDADHAVEPGWSPATRLSSYWAAASALLLSLLEWPAALAHHPFWGYSPPWFVYAVASAVGWFALIQSLLHVQRDRIDKTGYAAEPAPAVMLHRVSTHMDVRAIGVRSAIYGAVPAFLVLVAWFSFPVPTVLAALLFVGSLGVTGAVTMSRLITAEYRSAWAERAEKALTWSNNFMFMKNEVPMYHSEIQMPSVEEWEQEQAAAVAAVAAGEEPAPYVPEVHIATFMFPPGGTTFRSYIGIEENINGAIGATTSAVVPIGQIEAETGSEILGTIGSLGFRLWWTDRNVNPQMLLDGDTSDWMREFLARAFVMAALAKLRGLGYCTFVKANLITRKTTSFHIMQVEVLPGAGVSLQSFLEQIPALQTSLGFNWVRVDESSSKGAKTITILMSQNHRDSKVAFVNPPRRARMALDRADWLYYFHSVGLRSAAGSPELMSRSPSTPVVDELVFTLPGGMPFSNINSPKTLEALRSTSGNEFIEASIGESEDATRKAPTSLAQREKEAAAASHSKFTIIAAQKDPLTRMFPYPEYRDQIITGRVPGVAKTVWAPGVMANDKLAQYDPDAELPHLLIAGASGNGKSVISNSMICQLMANNGPDEVRFWMIEPKNELQVYRNVDLVDRFVDTFFPDEHFYENVADMLEDLVGIMNNRYRLMISHPKSPKKLEKAREIAIREGPKADGSPHDLYMPFIYCIIEECATVFADAASKSEREQQGRILAAAAELARKARAAGIYLVALTQYPTNASIPSVIRNQMRRIGLGCQNSMASQVVIGESGLEQIRTKGVGMVTAGQNYRKFRGLWLRDGDLDFGEPNDVLEILSSLPTRDGNDNSAATAWGSGQIVVPEPDQMVFNVWNRTTGINLETAVHEGLVTADIPDGATDDEVRINLEKAHKKMMGR